MVSAGVHLQRHEPSWRWKRCSAAKPAGSGIKAACGWMIRFTCGRASAARLSLCLPLMHVQDYVRNTLVSYSPLRHRPTRKRVVHARRRLFEAVGSARYSMPAHDGLDRKLQQYLPANGVFLEAGANDGYTWSNTYYLERWRGWRGVLIEGIPSLCRECRALRSRSSVYNCALVEPGFPHKTVAMTYSDLRSLIKGSEPEMEKYVATHGSTYEVQVEARTLDEILRDAGIETLDFVSLDLEGFEAPALRGLDFDSYRPQWMLIETEAGGGRRAVDDVLGERYVAVEGLTAADVLYRRRDR